MPAVQRLDLRQKQTLTMTPQLQQAIKLLRLSNIELAEFVADEIERNPLLIHNDPTGSKETTAPLNTDTPVYTNRAQTGSTTPDADGFDLDHWPAGPKSLHQHLHEQLAIAGFNQTDRLIATSLIAETDDNGYCKVNIENMTAMLGTSPEAILSVLRACHGFTPTGIMARDLRECLALQLAEKDRLDPAMQCLLDNLHLVASHDIDGLQAACALEREDVLDMLGELRALSPRPAAHFAPEDTILVIPDILVQESPDGTFIIELNTSTLPRVLMDKAYHARINASSIQGEEKIFVDQCAADANWLIKALDQRARTILKVASEIVREQDAFLVHGVAHLRPMNLQQIADATNTHVSTVSRVTCNKFMATPRGVFELKYFLSTAIPATGEGGSHSAESIRHRIKQLIEAEGQNILSDGKIVSALTRAGIKIARRTVTKYRESLNIPSSVERRQMLKTMS